VVTLAEFGGASGVLALPPPFASAAWASGTHTLTVTLASQVVTLNLKP